jgi:hypothetical protein
MGRNDDQNQRAISDLKAVSIRFRYSWENSHCRGFSNVRRGLDRKSRPRQNVGVDHGGGAVRISQEFSHREDIVVCFKEKGGSAPCGINSGVAQRMPTQIKRFQLSRAIFSINLIQPKWLRYILQHHNRQKPYITRNLVMITN